MKYFEIIKGISNESKYTKWYVNICKNAITRKLNDNEYLEVHHIVPKSFNMGGEKAQNNLVILTLREHFLCHHLLTKMMKGELLQKTQFAFWSMFSFRQDKIPCTNSRFFESARKQFIHKQSKNRIEWIENNPNYFQECTNRFTKMWQDPEIRNHLTKCRQDYWSTETARDKQSLAKKEYFKDNQEARNAVGTHFKELYATDEWQEKLKDPERLKKSLHSDETKAKAKQGRIDNNAAQKAVETRNKRFTKEELAEKASKGAKDKRWITDENVSVKIDKGLSIPEGWRQGRHFVARGPRNSV